MIYLTADLHLGHDAIIGYTGRPWQNAHEMNDVLLSNALALLGEHDHLYVLGDFALHRTEFVAYANALRSACNVTFIRGNHDCKQAEGGLADEFRWNKRHYYVCHYPWARWRPNTVMLHGHCHGNPVPLPDDPRQHMRFDVGVDTEWDGRRYYPVSIEQVESRILKADEGTT